MSRRSEYVPITVIEDAATRFGDRSSNSSRKNLIRGKNSVFLLNKRSPLYRHYLTIYYMHIEFIWSSLKTSEPFNLLERVRLMDSEPFPYPGTNAARRHGCLCPDARPAQGTMENPWILDVHCPLHGESAYEEHKKGPRH